MAANADSQVIDRLGFQPGFVVQEFGWADDVDDDLREAIEDLTDNELADEDFDDVTDGAIVWYRDEDGDLVDLLVDVQAALEDGAAIWVFFPKPGRDGHVDHNEIQEAAQLAGMNATSTFSIADDWSATKLSYRGRGK
ncbi:DUF3052 domain-containing protein [Populibacterium corticicola]|uniref:DUF3052 domain-containing protein n=1 Tax=Populibacterium corticicola TaxID=1812826 RepID=A0ABW5XCW4_9MICO